MANEPNDLKKTLRVMGITALVTAALAAIVLVVLHLRSESADSTSATGASPSGPSGACKSCEEAGCSKVLAACTSKQCLDVLACVRQNKCGDAAGDTFAPCYCGSTNQDDCFFAKAPPNGPCKAVIEAGMQSTNPLEVAQRYLDMAYPAGQALQLAMCDMARCKQCL